jgi:hypothetical protein
MPDISCKGFEFSDYAVQNAVCSDIIQYDLTSVLELPKNNNTLGICLEVLEHIDDEHHEIVLKNLINNTSMLIFTAALPGQGGTGHINCRPRIDWISRFQKLGWFVDIDATEHLVKYMLQGPHMGWFVENVIVLTNNTDNKYYYKHY